MHNAPRLIGALMRQLIHALDNPCVRRGVCGDAAMYFLVGFGIVGWYSQLGVGLIAQWASDANYSHGFLIPPLAVYFAWQQRHLLAAQPRQPAAYGAAVVILGLALYVVGRAAAELFVARLSLLPVIVGSIWFVAGREHLRVLRFPLLYLVLMIPLPALVFDRITVPLQIFASHIGEILLRSAAVPVLRDGRAGTRRAATGGRWRGSRPREVGLLRL